MTTTLPDVAETEAYRPAPPPSRLGLAQLTEEHPCPACRGEGSFEDERCAVCGGSGFAGEA